MQLYGQQSVGRAILPRQHRVAQRVQAVNLVPGDPDVDHVAGDLDGYRLHYHLGISWNRLHCYHEIPSMTAPQNCLSQFVRFLLFVLQHLISAMQCGS